jgi:hypothetical protein
MGICICPRDETSEHAWASKSSRTPKKFGFQNSKIKTTLIIFFDKQDVIHKELLPEGQTVNTALYTEVIGRLLKCISRVRPERSWFLLHDNTPTHSALVVKIRISGQTLCCGDKPPILFS